MRYTPTSWLYCSCPCFQPPLSKCCWWVHWSSHPNLSIKMKAATKSYTSLSISYRLSLLSLLWGYSSLPWSSDCPCIGWRSLQLTAGVTPRITIKLKILRKRMLLSMTLTLVEWTHKVHSQLQKTAITIITHQQALNTLSIKNLSRNRWSPISPTSSKINLLAIIYLEFQSI